MFTDISGFPYLRSSFDRSNLTKQEYATLSCSIIYINGPRLETFDWQKNGETIVSSKSPELPLTLLTTSIENPFGNVYCKVFNGYHYSSVVVLISEKGMWQAI